MSGKYQAYPEYKDSGVEWLGNIPSHWQVTPIMYLAVLNPRKSAIDSSLLNKECNFLPMEKLKLNSIVLDEKRLVSDVYDGYTYFEDGDVLMAKVTPCFENKNIAVASGLVNGVGFGSSEIYVLRSNEKTDSRFLYYRLQEDSFMDIATAAMTGAGGLKRVPSEVVNGYSLGTPEVEEQTQIANFLDHETAKIDTLIEKQQQLIKLLKEKRQAVISHAVTKGLNPQAPMKDSGVEWLGEVPEHWKIVSVRNLVRGAKLQIQDGNHGELHPVANDYVDDGIPFLMANNVRNGKVDTSSCKRIPKALADKLRIGFAKAGDILLTHKGTVGEVGIIPEEMREDYWMLTPQVTYYRWLHYSLCNEFFYYQFQSVSVATQLDIIAGKQSTRGYVGLIAQGDIELAIPPLNEQLEIASQLQADVKKHEDLIQKAEKLVLLQKERRTALISAAVTGKIDVRNWQAPTSEYQAMEQTA